MKSKMYEDHRYKKKVLAISFFGPASFSGLSAGVVSVAGSQYRWGC